MADYYALTSLPLPAPIHGSDGDYSIRALSDRERICIEDQLSGNGTRIALHSDTTAVIVPQTQIASAGM